jgi:hypothetical protein
LVEEDMSYVRATLWVVAAAAILGCASSDTGEGGGGGPLGTVGSAGGCAQGTSTACTCADGSPGSAACQLDGTFSVACQCNGTAGGPVGGPTGNPGSSPGGSGVAGGTAPPPGGGPMPMPGDPPPPANTTGVVIVPPEDVSACAGAGTPPMAGEQVEVIEVLTSDAVPGGFAAPGGTFYGCFWVDLDMPEKHHIIGWEGAVGANRVIHHQQVSLSQKPFYLTQQGGLCGLPTVDFTWTGERPTEWTPGLAGYPIGGPENGGKAHFLWQVHFEGATTYTGGFKVYVTKNLRKYDAGNFEQGDVRGISIPPMAAKTHVATCTPEMTTQKLVHPIYVYASMLHAHLTIRHIKAEQRRDGQTIQVFGDQMVGGFLGFFDQSFMPHTPCIEIKPGDELVTTCDFQNPFNFEVTGGEATNQEMCTTFMQYFPRLPGTSNNFCGTIDSTGGFGP